MHVRTDPAPRCSLVSLVRDQVTRPTDRSGITAGRWRTTPERRVLQGNRIRRRRLAIIETVVALGSGSAPAGRRKPESNPHRPAKAERRGEAPSHGGGAHEILADRPAPDTEGGLGFRVGYLLPYRGRYSVSVMPPRLHEPPL
jgi:hypothetical protein